MKIQKCEIFPYTRLVHIHPSRDFFLFGFVFNKFKCFRTVTDGSAIYANVFFYCPNGARTQHTYIYDTIRGVYVNVLDYNMNGLEKLFLTIHGKNTMSRRPKCSIHPNRCLNKISGGNRCFSFVLLWRIIHIQ